jgi:hypothetical protein
MCDQLGVPVQGEWKACVLASHPFSTPWDAIEDVMRLENSLALDYSEKNSASPAGLAMETGNRASHSHG